ncbi:hypothetical protein OG982_11050 [Streptomyces sp. NBC_01551]|uniref:hypothetical protein n=1 Tax=Streptomyces sp. NBC_01551 TaxID=2975876 RepID=UPI002256C2D1|nr:hypothetical protein [Streptomyces sp. NBC_01551]MCX4526214.1 hypothetical protein [Streptomyces sp. NBC_01551]
MVALRVLFAALPILSCGFFAWGSLLRLALVTRKNRDWTLLVVGFVVSVACIVLVGLDKTPDTSGWQSDLGAGGSILSGFAICVYFLVGDIRHHEAKAAAGQAHWAAPGPYQAPAPYAQGHQTVPGYGYPPAPRTPTPTPAPIPAPNMPPATTPPPRIGQVRAELDELSELLRRQTPSQNPAPNPNPGHPYQDPSQTAFQDPDQ